jgi:hypothetical protein
MEYFKYNKRMRLSARKISPHSTKIRVKESAPMSYQVHKMPDLPIVLLRFSPDFNFKQEGEVALASTRDLLGLQTERVFLVSDMQMPPPSFDELVAAINLSARQLELFKHPKVRGNIFISSNPMITVAARGANLSVFGSLNIKVLKNMDAALAYVNAELSQ